MISVCMPYWERPAELERSLVAYKKVYGETMDLEFSICDDGSTHKPVVPRHDKRFIVTTLPRKLRAMNPCVPINRAVRASTGDIIVLTNPEIEHREPVLWWMLQALQGPNDYVMTGCRNAKQRIGLMGVMGDEWIAGPEAPQAPAGGRQPMPPGAYLNFCVMFYRSLFDKVGGFDEKYRHGLGCDDNDWAWKLYAAGANFKYVPGTVWHYRTRHSWLGTLETNKALLEKKWSHLEKFECVS